MKKEKIDFNVELRDAFGEVITESKEQGSKERIPVWVNKSLINALAHPYAVPEGKTLDANSIVARLLLQQKVAAKEPQEYGTDELAIIREAVVTLYNRKSAGVELVGTILKMTE